ncbi:MAG: 50S ribosomal protein L6 [Patescibacteria group bacterium]
MSRIGKMPIKILAGVEAKMQDNVLIIKGQKGEIKCQLHPDVQLDIDVGVAEIRVTVKEPDNKKDRALWGLFRSIVANMVTGVTTGFEKKLEINGIGYKAVISGQKLTLNVGYSHPVEFILPTGITGKVDANVITLNGIDKQLLGEVAANIRKVRKPEPYLGKGIKYLDEVLRHKVGKSGAKTSS